MNSPIAQYCSACGYELGLEPIVDGPGIDCIECGAGMTSFNGDPGKLHDCARCGSQFVDHILLRNLLERRTLYGQRLQARVRQSNPLDSPVIYLNCPECHDQLVRYNFGGRSGIIVDACSRHGTWFHQGELPRVLAFVEAGGLQEAKRRELGMPTQLSREQRRLLGEALAKAQREPDDSLELELLSSIGQEIFATCVRTLRTLGRWVGSQK